MEYRKMSIISRIILRFLRLFVGENNNNKVNWLATIYFNLRVLSFREAVKLPVYIYGKVKFINLDGVIEFTVPIKKGMIKLGKNVDLFTGDKEGVILLMANSKIIFNGPMMAYKGFILRVSRNAILNFGYRTILGSNVKICCDYDIKIGDNSAISFESQVIDTNFHYTINLKDKKVYRCRKAIKIGSGNWIGNRSVIMKGTITPDDTIVASSSLINKDYSIDGKKGILIVGSPGKVLSENNKEIVSSTMEKDLDFYFLHNEKEEYKIINELNEQNLFSRENQFL